MHDVPRAITYLQHAARTDQVRSAHREARHTSVAPLPCSSRPGWSNATARSRAPDGTVLIATQVWISEVELLLARASCAGGPAVRAAIRRPCGVCGSTTSIRSAFERETADALSIAQRSDRQTALLQAHHAQWATMFPLGTWRPCEDYAERGIALYPGPPRRARSLRAHVRAGVPELSARAARPVARDGRPRYRRSIAHALQLAHPFSLALALAFAAFVRQRVAIRSRRGSGP
jgi:hypothetical protein